jgi:phosphoribosylamine--glycine ligase
VRILVIGSGAREHALVWKLAQSSRVSKVYAAPGNPGMLADAECVAIGSTDFAQLVGFVEKNAIDLTVVGPEVPLIEGIVDYFQERKLAIFGPSQAAAALEGSKAFAKELMTSAGIPTAQHRTFSSYQDALMYLEAHGAPVVIKADGNAAGKGAIVALDIDMARAALREMMQERIFGIAGDTVVIEDYLQGNEIGSHAICDGSNFLPLTLTQDHKRALDHDQGLNTGGMGAYTPLPFITDEQELAIRELIIAPTLKAMLDRGIHFKGILYSNIMLTERGPMVIEHNTRMGDPETQALMLLLRADLLDLLQFPELRPEVGMLWHEGYAVCVALASEGYPGKYPIGLPISGIEETNKLAGVQVFHAGTALVDGQLVTAGGRVLSVTARGETLQEAVERAYEAAALISFKGVHYRKDIAWRGLRQG